MRFPATKRTGTQRGAALIIAMLVFALASALMVGLQRDFALTLQRGTNHLFSEQAWSYLMGAEGLAVLALREDARLDAKSESAADHLGEVWAQVATPYPLDAGGWLTGQLEDLQGRLNLNLLVSAPGAPTSGDSDGDSSLAAGEMAQTQDEAMTVTATAAATEETRWNPTQKMLIRLLQSVGEEPLSIEESMVLTDAITDFIDPDSIRRLNGAEDQEYRYQTFPYLPANQPLASVSEIRAVRGMTPAIYEALAPFLTVWPQNGGRVNVLTAPVPILRSINSDDRMDPLPLEMAERLFELRAEGAIGSVEAFLTNPTLDGLELGALQPFLATRSDWFVLDATVELLDRERHLYSVMRRTGDTSIAVFRTEGEL